MTADPNSFTFAFPGRDAPETETLGDVITRFLADAESGRVAAPDGQAYTRDSMRDMRAALAHVDTALGDVPVDRLDGDQVNAVLEELAQDGLAQSRIESVVLAMQRLSAYAGVAGPPAAVPPPVAAPPVPASAAPSPAPAPSRATPTMEMLGAARTIASWTGRAVVFLFALVVLLLILEL